ncbi:YozE family protein [Ornithinibacillus gellani]|uniref:YozE family protein n=1 Tax=Ornithinibacillus gellani TaxID=2293253 RepID=UPI000F478327|nr:YozE family protein [Ornithinibacillus gellani]TQS74362.1 YozE family protein [Ornithinibacillus gellani]
MQTFYQFLMTYRGKLKPDDESRLAEWAFLDHLFPKYSTSYQEISDYLEWNSPFSTALVVFDALWEKYENQ